MPPTALELRHTYRHCYRALLKAVLYSSPARYVARDRLRNAYRNGTVADYDPVKIARTLELLEGARKIGTEHRIVKNLLRVWWEQNKITYQHGLTPDMILLRRQAYENFNRMIKNLNDSMGLCIK